jgi:hypothetical protein
MALIKGITVYLHMKIPEDIDEFNRTQYREELVPVDNVLVAPVAQSDGGILSEIALNTKSARYQLAIPKDDTHDWEDCTVDFFGETWRSTGYSTMGIDDLIPLDWNRKVMVERYG